jgi:hypothetical protein
MFAFRIYLTYFITPTTSIRLPVWAFMAAIPALRPRPSWPFRRALILQAVKALVQLFFDIGFPVDTGYDPENIASSPAASESGFAWVDPLTLKELADRNDVQAVRTAGYWFYASSNIGGVEQVSSDEVVILHLHSSFPPHFTGARLDANQVGAMLWDRRTRKVDRPALSATVFSSTVRKSNGFSLVVIGLRPPLRFRPAYSIVSLVIDIMSMK